jgi:hypothetical protein
MEIFLFRHRRLVKRLLNLPSKSPVGRSSTSSTKQARLYEMLRLRVITGADGILKMSGMLGEVLEVSKSEPISRCTTRSKKGYEIEFCALLTDGAQEEVRFERVVVG